MTDDKKDEVSIDDLQNQINKLEEDDAKEMKEENSKNAKVTELELKVEELTNSLARSMADMQNYKRRTEDDKGSFVKFANAELLKQILPIIDNFDRCTAHLPKELENNDWAKGVKQIHDDLLKTLEKLGVHKIKTVGEILNPNLHEALMSGPGKKDEIIEEFEPGYTLNSAVIKAAKVKVGDGTKK
ncbi:nucleotide exchange factor GrpE [Candidatus Peregrinibacteria bacterium]|nr:nucleotide exchange factor GrpE [Candidatus Peregrinibacteria bacterium]